MKVTQSLPNFLGGVSRQPDTKKLPGQVKDIVNGNPNPVYGLMKRPGLRFIGHIPTAVNTANAKWFHIIRDGVELYAFLVNPVTGALAGYNLNTGNAVTVTVTDPVNVASYLAATSKYNLDVATVQDATFIVNKTKTVVALSANSTKSAKFGKQGTVRVLSAAYDSTYSFKITNLNSPGTSYTITYTTGAPPTTSPSTTDPGLLASTVAGALKTALQSAIPSATVSQINNNLCFECSFPFKIDVSYGIDGSLIRAYTDTVTSFSQLAAEEVNGRIVKVINDVDTTDDDYFAEFTVSDGTATGSSISGSGYWKETQDPRLSTGFDPKTMPVALINTAPNTFTLGFVNWATRKVGDDSTNPQPSFVGKKINHVFFYENRLGFLSDSNFLMSQADDYFNFYNNSAKTQTDSDPIDLNVSSLQPSALHSAVPITQGLLLFSDSEQFLLNATDTRLSPSTTKIRSIAKYENSSKIHPVTTGQDVLAAVRYYQDRQRGSTRVLSLSPQGLDQQPTINIITTVVEDWIPPTIDYMELTRDNTYLFMSDSSSPTMYCYRIFEQDDQKLMRSWFKWVFPGDVQYMFTTNREFYVVFVNTVGANTVATLAHGEFGLLSDNAVIRYPDTNQFINPSFDLWSHPNSITQKVYEDGTITTVIAPKFTDVNPDLTPVAVWTKGDESPEYTGNYAVLTRTEDGFEAPLDISDILTSEMYVGYQFTFEVDLPTVYLQRDGKADMTGDIIIARNKFVAGFTDSLEFEIKANGRPDWEPLYSNVLADFYKSDTTPISEGYIYNVPIHQRNTNYSIKVKSSTPFPISLVSMAWEGNYVPRFYRRA